LEPVNGFRVVWEAHEKPGSADLYAGILVSALAADREENATEPYRPPSEAVFRQRLDPSFTTRHFKAWEVIPARRFGQTQWAKALLTGPLNGLWGVSKHQDAAAWMMDNQAKISCFRT